MRRIPRGGYPTRVSVTRDVAASRQRVWDVLADGWTYSQWVVGNSRMRAVDQNWPAPGSTIRHSIGIWPAVIDDETVAEDCVPLEELVLLAKTGPAGAARMETTDVEGRIQVPHNVYERLNHAFLLEERGEVDVKGKGLMHTWYLVGRRNDEAVRLAVERGATAGSV